MLQNFPNMCFDNEVHSSSNSNSFNYDGPMFCACTFTYVYGNET